MLPRQLKNLLRDAKIPEHDHNNTLAIRAASQVNTYIRVINMKLNDSDINPHIQDNTVNQLLQRLHYFERLANADQLC